MPSWAVSRTAVTNLSTNSVSRRGLSRAARVTGGDTGPDCTPLGNGVAGHAGHVRPHGRERMRAGVGADIEEAVLPIGLGPERNAADAPHQAAGDDLER